MCALREQSVTEEQFTEFLQNGAQSRQFAHFIFETLAEDGQEWLKKRIFNSSDNRISSAEAGFAKLIGARQLAAEESKALEITALLNYFSYRKSLLANSLTAQEVANMLSVSRTTVHERIRSGQMIGVLENGIMKLPVFQFDPEGPNGIVPGLQEVLSVMRCSLLGKISWLVSTNSVFDGQKPIDILKKGELPKVVREAQAVGVV